jgi:hypothetical protein
MKNNNSSSSNNYSNIMLVLGLVAVVMSLTGLTITYYKTNQLREQITGNAIGIVNLSIVQEININVTRSIEWGEGVINTTGGWNYAVLETTSGGAGNVSSGGNWSTAGGKTQAMEIINLGNVNCSLTLDTLINNAHNMFGGTPAYENYTWKLSDKEAGACAIPSTNYSRWFTPNDSIIICRNMGFIDSKDEIYFNVELWVPYDANITTNKEGRGDTITITAGTALAS